MAQEIQLQIPFDLRENDRLRLPKEAREEVVRDLAILLLEFLEVEAHEEDEEGSHDLQ